MRCSRLVFVCRALTCCSLTQSVLVFLDLLRSQLQSLHSCGEPSRRFSRYAPVCCRTTAGAEGQHTPHSCVAISSSRQGIGVSPVKTDNIQAQIDVSTPLCDPLSVLSGAFVFC